MYMMYMYVYVCVCVCVHVCVGVSVCVCENVYVYMCFCVPVCMCMCLCPSMCLWLFTCVCLRLCVCVSMPVSGDARVCSWLQTPMKTFVPMYKVLRSLILLIFICKSAMFVCIWYALLPPYLWSFSSIICNGWGLP